MTSLRHQHAIARIKFDAHRLTPDERRKLNLPVVPRLRHQEPPPFPGNPGAFVWFALTTAKRSEDKAVLDLARAGFVAFNPTEVVSMRAGRKARFRRSERYRSLLTSVVLAGFRGRWIDRHRGVEVMPVLHADVPWLRVMQLERITGVIGMGDGPVPVPLGNVMALSMLSGRRGSTRNWSAAVGDRVEVSMGPWQGQHGHIVELTNGEARVALFGTGLLSVLAEPLTVPETWVRDAAE